MNITKRLMQLDQTLEKHNEGEWSGTISEFEAFNDAGVECEVGEFLYSAVRILKPENVLETGTHFGIGASYMGLGLADNNKGHLDTVEFLPEIHQVAVDRINRIGLLERVTPHLGDVSQFNNDKRYQLIFLDTEPILRFQELIKFYPQLDAGGYFFIHDTPRNLCQGNVNTDHPHLPSWPFGDLPDEIRTWVRDGKLRSFHFGTPRGLVGFYKVHQDDVQW